MLKEEKIETPMMNMKKNKITILGLRETRLKDIGDYMSQGTLGLSTRAERRDREEWQLCWTSQQQEMWSRLHNKATDSCLELCADVIVSAAARQSISVGGGGAGPPPKKKTRPTPPAPGPQ